MASSASESKTPLIVGLVVSVLALLTVGTLYYLSLEEKATAEEAKKKADAEKTAADGLKQEYQDKVLMYRAAVGVASQADLDALKNTSKKDKVVEEYKLVAGELQKVVAGLVTAESQKMPGMPFNVPTKDVLDWPAGETGTFDAAPKLPLIGVVVNAYGRQQLASNKMNTAIKEAADAMADAAKRGSQSDAAAKAYADAAAKYPELLKAEVAATEARFNVELAKLGDTTKKYTDTMRASAVAEEELKIKTAQAQSMAAGLKNQVDRLNGVAAEKEDPFAFQKPHGQITSKRDGTVTINLGSSDLVRPGLTFSVQPAETRTLGLDSRKVEYTAPNGRKSIVIKKKGTIEVVDVLGPNVSTAKITGEDSPIREAILPGDILYNPAWRKGAPDHVALYGVFDLDGDGTDDIKVLVRDLQKVGVVVDAYYDLEKSEWQGKPTKDTAFAVEGAYPSNAAVDGLSAAKAAVSKKLDEAKTQALNTGIKVVRARDFFPQIGYKARLDVPPDVINRAYNRYLLAAPTPPAAPADAPEPAKN